MASHSEELDAEGIPDLDDSLPEKEITGDAQEGLVPPSDRKLAPDDIYARDTLDQRLREEVPDRIKEEDEAPRLMDSGSDDLEDRSAAETETGSGAERRQYRRYQETAAMLKPSVARTTLRLVPD